MSRTYLADNKWRIVERLGLPMYIFELFTLDALEAIQDIIKKDTRRRSLLVIDDMSRDLRLLRHAEYTYNRLVSNCRWMNLSIIQSAQMVTHVPPEMRVQWDYMITFKPENKDEAENVYKTAGCGTRTQFDILLDKCCSEAYSFLYINRNSPITHYFKRFTPLEIKDH